MSLCVVTGAIRVQLSDCSEPIIDSELEENLKAILGKNLSSGSERPLRCNIRCCREPSEISGIGSTYFVGISISGFLQGLGTGEDLETLCDWFSRSVELINNHDFFIVDAAVIQINVPNIRSVIGYWYCYYHDPSEEVKTGVEFINNEFIKTI